MGAVLCLATQFSFSGVPARKASKGSVSQQGKRARARGPVGDIKRRSPGLPTPATRPPPPSVRSPWV